LQSVKKTGQFFSQFINQVAIPNCRSRGIEEPHAPSFFKTLVEDNTRARFVQDTNSFGYPDRLEELGDCFRNQHWMHMHNVLRTQGSLFKSLAIKVARLP
jgi:hypothetical protein